MAYRIVFTQRARKEIKNVIDYYALYSDIAPTNFLNELNDAYDVLTSYPFFAVKYQNVRALKLKRFSYSLYFVINEEHRTVRVLSCFHNMRNPYKRPSI